MIVALQRMFMMGVTHKKQSARQTTLRAEHLTYLVLEPRGTITVTLGFRITMTVNMLPAIFPLPLIRNMIGAYIILSGAIPKKYGVRPRMMK